MYQACKSVSLTAAKYADFDADWSLKAKGLFVFIGITCMYTVSKYTSLCTQMVKPVSIGTVLQVFVAFVSRVSVKPTNQFKDLSFYRCFKWVESEPVKQWAENSFKKVCCKDHNYMATYMLREPGTQNCDVCRLMLKQWENSKVINRLTSSPVKMLINFGLTADNVIFQHDTFAQVQWQVHNAISSTKFIQNLCDVDRKFLDSYWYMKPVRHELM